MFRATAYSIIAVLLVASAARADIVEPVFVRGSRLNAGSGTGVPFDSLTAFNSAADMATWTNGWGERSMTSSQWGCNRWHLFDGTNYYRIEATVNNAPWRLHSYGSDLGNLMADSVVSTQDFTSNPVGIDSEDVSVVSFFADTDGSIYEAWSSTGSWETTDTIRKFDSVASLLSGAGTDSNSFAYAWGDTFIGVNGTFYRTNTSNIDGSLADYQISGIAEYASFADLLSNNAAAVYGGGNGLSWDLLMAVPRAALSVGSGAPAPVPEIDPAGIGSVLVLVGGGLGLLERRRKRA
jgi:hypothetical protein